MIVQMHTGAVLELFWRHRGVRSWSQATALAFLLRYRNDRQAIDNSGRALHNGSQRLRYGVWGKRTYSGALRC